ncbi:uncharacterized protein CC84DRAFT_1227113 [Paraphaeosphaeria sporulosa]|uniref:Uncharacterized protein n=1 Tax=Paraphaeosphaeria sporulosa TaxID=1460663 RepID=A0A177CZ70_9PLEO|nr:uncharacterized protein CC84DRAFT_1227113 [Paraphaeosphaeria sporulosa]OAG12576.1 hypothetical protein CC84DRAFT_1227113 [Paraphaeosphaeria sporulosa]
MDVDRTTLAQPEQSIYSVPGISALESQSPRYQAHKIFSLAFAQGMSQHYSNRASSVIRPVQHLLTFPTQMANYPWHPCLSPRSICQHEVVPQRRPRSAYKYRTASEYDLGQRPYPPQPRFLEQICNRFPCAGTE